MKVVATYPKKRTLTVHYAACIAAGMVTLMLMLQLFTFESYPALVAQIVGVSVPMASIVAAKLVALELFALPYLLAMKLSPLLRIVSMVCALMVAVFWFLAGMLTTGLENSGIFGASLMLEGGAAPICWGVLLLGLVVYVVSSTSLKRSTHS